MNRIAERELSTGEMLDAASCPHKLLWNGTYTANLQPVRPGKFKKTRYSLVQCLAVRCARLAHTKFNIAPADMADFVSRLWSMSATDLEAEFEKGRTAFLIINRKPGDEFFAPSAVMDVDRILKERGVTAEVYAVSLQHEWERILERILPKPMAPAEIN